MKRLTMLVLILALFASLAACGPTEPASRLDAVQKAKVIKVGTSADYPPFESVDASGKKVGFDIELMEEVAKRMEVEIEWVDMPFDSLIAGVQEGKIDMAISAFNYTEERDQVVDFSETYFVAEDSFLAAEGFAGAINDPNVDLASYKVGVQSGTTQDGWLTELVAAGKLPEANLFRYDRADQAALDLKAGRIELVMTENVIAAVTARKLGGLKVVYNGQLVSGPYNMVLPEGDTKLAKAVNDIVRELQAEGFVSQLAEKHLAGE